MTDTSQIKVGDKLPSVILYESTPDNEINVCDFVSDKRVILFGVPGAFVPGCTKIHLSGFIEKSEELKSKGFQEIICVSVNDVFVMAAWGNYKGANNKIRMFADPTGEFTKAIKMDINVAELGGIRSCRYSMVIINSIVRDLYVDSGQPGSRKTSTKSFSSCCI